MSMTLYFLCLSGYFCYIMIGVGAVNLEGPFHSSCLGQVIQLNCSHPFNDGSLRVIWERNGTIFHTKDEYRHYKRTYEIVDVHLTSDTFKDKCGSTDVTLKILIHQLETTAMK